jgi:hypothetical protein
MSKHLWTIAIVLAGGACASDDPAGTDQPQFDCASMEGTPGLMFCEDFNDGLADDWSAEGGDWSVMDGRYVGIAPESVLGSECGASLMTASLYEGISPENVGFHVEMQGFDRLEKTIVLRAVSPSNRIELNFRGDPINDLMVQELRDCELVYHTTEGEIAVPHGMEPISVDVELRGDSLIVLVGGQPIVDRTFPFAIRPGRVGVAVIENSSVAFDSVWTESL